MPGEAQKIDRMMECFAQRYCELNPGVFTSTGMADLCMSRCNIALFVHSYAVYFSSFYYVNNRNVEIFNVFTFHCRCDCKFVILLFLLLHTSDVRIVFFHFESNRIEYWTIIRNCESNRIVFAVLKSRYVKFVFFLNANFSC